MIVVRNMRTAKIVAEYSPDLGPRAAVIAVYAQARGDHNTWDYETRYGAKAYHGRRFWYCGDYAAPMTEAEVAQAAETPQDELQAAAAEALAVT